MRSPARASTRSPGEIAAIGVSHASPSSMSLVAVSALIAARLEATSRVRAAHPLVEIAAGEQEQHQHDRAVEIGLARVLQRLHDRQHQRQRDADGDRHVHVERELAQRPHRAVEERPPGVGDARQHDQRRQPMEEVARRPAAWRRPRPTTAPPRSASRSSRRRRRRRGSAAGAAPPPPRRCRDWRRRTDRRDSRGCSAGRGSPRA